MQRRSASVKLVAVAEDHAGLGHLDDLRVGTGRNACEAQALREQQRVVKRLVPVRMAYTLSAGSGMVISFSSFMTLPCRSG